jgi:hypothetical protein
MPKNMNADDVAKQVTEALQPGLAFKVSPKPAPLPIKTPLPAPLARALGIDQTK